MLLSSGDLQTFAVTWQEGWETAEGPGIVNVSLLNYFLRIVNFPREEEKARGDFISEPTFLASAIQNTGKDNVCKCFTMFL